MGFVLRLCRRRLISCMSISDSRLAGKLPPGTASGSACGGWVTRNVQRDLRRVLRKEARPRLRREPEGLADTVRTHGGVYTKNKWLNVDVPHK